MMAGKGGGTVEGGGAKAPSTVLSLIPVKEAKLAYNLPYSILDVNFS